MINEGEAREFASDASLVKAARTILELGAKTLIIKAR